MDLSVPAPILAAFVGNDAWFTFLLVLHVFGAVVGLGPTFVFPMIGKTLDTQPPPPAALALMELNHKIEKGMVTPILLVVQSTTGIGMIFNRGINNDFFGSRNRWLTAALGMYLAALIIAMGFVSPGASKLIEMAKGGQAGSPEFMKGVALQKRLGPVLGILSVGILLLMVWKPGSGCGPLLRC